MYDARVENPYHPNEGWSMLTSAAPRLSAEARAEYWTLRCQEANLANAELRETIMALRKLNLMHLAHIAKLEAERGTKTDNGTV